MQTKVLIISSILYSSNKTYLLITSKLSERNKIYFVCVRKVYLARDGESFYIHVPNILKKYLSTLLLQHAKLLYKEMQHVHFKQ